MVNQKGIYVGVGGTAPGEWKDGVCEWHDTRVYVHPLIDGISDKLWKRIYNETNEIRPMFGKDGSKVYADMDEYEIVRIVSGKRIVIANITEVG